MRSFFLGFSLLALVAACSGSPERTGTTSGGNSNGGGGSGDGDGDGSLPPDFAECASDTVTAGLGRAGNIVWVIDTSGSMDEEAALVQQNMNRFVESIIGAGLEDYRVVVVSEKSFVDVPDPLGSDREHFLFVQEKVSSNEPLEDLLSRFDDFGDFLLPGAITHYVVVTDDESDISAKDFISQMGDSLQGGEFRVHAIASPPGAPPPPPSGDDDDDDDDDDTGCVGTYGDAAAAGVQHYLAAEMTSGLTFSICEADWSGLFSELATEVGATATIPCDLAIPPASDMEQGINFEQVNVVLTQEAGGAREVIPRSSSSGSSCSGRGWTYDDLDAPTRIVLCSESCSAASRAASLDIALGCATTVL